LILLVVATVSLALSGGVKNSGIVPGHPAPPFALPLATGNIVGDANIATHADEGSAGSRPACSVRGTGLLNVCQLYEGAPLVLSLFVEGGGCPRILAELQALAPSFPGVRFAGVAIAGSRTALRHLIAQQQLTIPVGLDPDGAVGALYHVIVCPTTVFIYPGGIVQSQPLLGRPAPATLRARIARLLAAARARGWRG
jgi:AhpC/TSA family